MTVVGFITIGVLGAWLSFFITFFAVMAMGRGGLSDVVPAAGMGFMAVIIWGMAYGFVVHP